MFVLFKIPGFVSAKCYCRVPGGLAFGGFSQRREGASENPTRPGLLAGAGGRPARFHYCAEGGAGQSRFLQGVGRAGKSSEPGLDYGFDDQGRPPLDGLLSGLRHQGCRPSPGPPHPRAAARIPEKSRCGAIPTKQRRARLRGRSSFHCPSVDTACSTGGARRSGRARLGGRGRRGWTHRRPGIRLEWPRRCRSFPY